MAPMVLAQCRRVDDALRTFAAFLQTVPGAIPCKPDLPNAQIVHRLHSALCQIENEIADHAAFMRRLAEVARTCTDSAGFLVSVDGLLRAIQDLRDTLHTTRRDVIRASTPNVTSKPP